MASLSSRLDTALAAASPNAKIVHRAAGSVDADFYRMVHAPLLVTAAGSFAVAAAVAGHGRAIRTPASDNLNFPHLYTRAEETMADNWRTYAYSMEELGALAAPSGRRLHRKSEPSD